MCSSSCNLSNRPRKPRHARLPPSPPRSSSSSLIWHHLHHKNLTSKEQWESTYLWIKLSSFLVISNKLVIYTQSTVTVISGWFFLAKNVNNYQLQLVRADQKSELKKKKNTAHLYTILFNTKVFDFGTHSNPIQKKSMYTDTNLSVSYSLSLSQCQSVSQSACHFTLLQ